MCQRRWRNSSCPDRISAPVLLGLDRPTGCDAAEKNLSQGPDSLEPILQGKSPILRWNGKEPKPYLEPAATSRGSHQGRRIINSSGSLGDLRANPWIPKVGSPRRLFLYPLSQLVNHSNGSCNRNPSARRFGPITTGGKCGHLDLTGSQLPPSFRFVYRVPFLRYRSLHLWYP